MPRRFLHRHQPPRCHFSSAKAALGALVGLSLVALLGQWSGAPLLLAPLGASAVLLFGLPESPLSQPANMIAGHVIATVLALGLDRALPPGPWSMALAVGLVIGILGALRLTHPPAGADPIVVMTLHPDWHFVLSPVLVGAVGLVVAGVLAHRLPPRRAEYPLPVRRDLEETP